MDKMKILCTLIGALEMDEMKILCSLIAALMDEYSECVVEDGTLSFRFDCKDYHYECKIERTLMDGGEDEKTSN